jgi:hypothetical protein
LSTRIHSRVLRKIIRLANHYRGETPAREWLERTNVVYLIYHVKTSRYYIGETNRTAFMRLREHWYGRTRVGDQSALSEFFAAQSRFVPNVAQFCRLFVIADCESETQRKRTEMNVIAYLRQGCNAHLCLNHVAPVGKRLRHRALLVSPRLVRPPSDNPDVRQESAPSRCIDHITSMWNRRHQEAALKHMSLRKLHEVKRFTAPNTWLRLAIQDTITAKLADAKTCPTRTVFVLPFGSKEMDNLHFSKLRLRFGL